MDRLETNQPGNKAWSNPAHYWGRAVGVCGSIMIAASIWRGGFPLTLTGLIATFAGMALLLTKPTLADGDPRTTVVSEDNVMNKLKMKQVFRDWRAPVSIVVGIALIAVLALWGIAAMVPVGATTTTPLGAVPRVSRGSVARPSEGTVVVGTSSQGGSVVGFGGGGGSSIAGENIVQTEWGDYAVEGVPVFAKGATAEIVNHKDGFEMVSTLCIRQSVEPKSQCYPVK